MSFDKKRFELFFGKMVNDWPIMTLQEVCRKEKGSIISGPFGSSISKKFFVEEGVPVIRGNNLALGTVKFIDDGFVFVTNEKAKSLNTYARRHDLVFTAAGTIGQVGIITDDCKYDEYIISNKQLRATLDETIVNPLYAYYWFSTDQMCKYINLQNTGSTIPLINLKILRELPIAVPPLDIQNSIVSVLSEIDHKLELNNKINSQLTSACKTIYKSWFVDFDNNGGKVPEGWEHGLLKDIVKIKKKAIKPGDNNDLPYLPIDLIPMNDLAIHDIRPNEDAQSSLITFEKGDILLGAMRVYFHRVAVAPFDGITRTTCFVLSPKEKEYYSFALFCIDEDSTIDYAQATSKGTTMPYAIWDNGLGDMDIIVPDKKTANEYCELTKPFIELIRDSFFENTRLKEAQEMLIPRLLSGEIDVSKVLE